MHMYGKTNIIKKRNGILALAIIILLIVASANISVSAEEFSDTGSDCVVEVDYLYTDENGNSHLLKQSCGVLIGNSGNGASHVLASRTMVTLNEEELLQFYEQYQIPEDRQDRISMNIQIVVAHDIKIDASVSMESDSMNLVVLSLNQQIYNKAIAVFDLDESNAFATESICTRGYETGQTRQGVVIDVFQQEGVSYIRHNIAVSGNEIGCPVMNSENEVIGICLLPGIDGRKQALNIKEAAVVLMTLGIPYTAADHTDYSTDKSALETALQVTLFMDLSGYTEETVVSMNEAIVYAQSVISDEAVTQETIDEAYTNLIAAQSGLMKDDRLDVLTVIMIIVAGILLLLLCTIGMIYFIRKNKKAKEEKEREELEAKKAPKAQGPYVPCVKKETVASMEGFAPSRKEIQFNTEDTMVLSENDYSERNNEIGLDLLYAGTEKIHIETNSFIIGKSKEKTDFCVNNNSVSRQHAKIVRRGKDFFLIDLNSTNGTYIDEEKCIPGQEYHLTDGMQIKMAKEIFCVRGQDL